MPSKHTITELMDYYREKGLIAHDDAIATFSQKVSKLPTEVPPEDVRSNAALLLAWPSVEKYRAIARAETEDLSANDQDRINQLKLKQARLLASEDAQRVHDGLDSILRGNFEFRILNPYVLDRGEFLDTVLSVMCEPLERHVARTRLGRIKLLHDAQMGGSIYITGHDNANPPVDYANSGSTSSNLPVYSFMQRSFICLDRQGTPVLFMDNIEGGAPYFKFLDHWRGFDEERKEKTYRNRIAEVYFAMGAAMYVASQLGIRHIVPRDYELAELSRLLGVGEKMIFSKDQAHWKIGLHSRRRHTGIYVHSLYRGTRKNYEGNQLRHPRLDYTPIDNPDRMLGELERLYDLVTTENQGRTKRPAALTYERLSTIYSLNELINTHPFSTDAIKQLSAVRTQDLTLDIGRFNT